MRKYSDIVKTLNRKTSRKTIPKGFTLLYYDKDHNMCHHQNFPPEILKDIDDKNERFRLRQLYLKDVDRLVKYIIEDLEKENEEYTIEEILEYIGFYDDVENDSYDSNEDNMSGDSDYYSD